MFHLKGVKGEDHRLSGDLYGELLLQFEQLITSWYANWSNSNLDYNSLFDMNVNPEL